MRLTKILIAVLLLTTTIVARGQVRSKGEVPADLKMGVQELYDTDMQRAEKYLGGRVRSKKKVLKASYNINKMMASGRIIYGDAVSHLAERIADTLLKGYPELRSELRFYTVNSPEVNAFATGQGMVFVNLGLIAQAENEAQIAFILSHEIIHYLRSHTMEELVGKSGEEKEATVEGESTEMVEFIRRHNRSREMESEADSLGIAMFYRQSPYDQGVCEGVFDVLQYGALPFDDVEFDTTWFNTPYYSLTGCWLPEVTGITSRDNYDDRSSTHPNILSRRRKCSSMLSGRGGSEFVTISREEFLALRQQARMECVRQEVIHGQYARAFYNAWLLRNSPHCSEADAHPLDRQMAYALYCYAMHKAHNSSITNSSYLEIQGESQQVYYALQTMSKEEILLVALHAVWTLHLQFPEQKEYDLMASDLMEELRFAGEKNIGDYLDKPPAVSIADSTAQEEQPMSKYDRIKQKRHEQTTHTPSAYALTDLMMKDSTFITQLNGHLGGTADLEQNEDTTGNKGMIVFNPTYMVTDHVKNKMKISKSVKNERRLTERLARAGKRLGIKSVDFSDIGLHQMVSDTQYNDFLTLCEWMNEFWLAKGAYTMRYAMQPQMDDLIARHGASRVNLTALLNIENLPSHVSVTDFLLIPVIPVILFTSFNGTESTAMASLVVDTRQGKVLTSQSYSSRAADHNALVDAMLHDTYSRAMRGKVPSGFLGRHAAIAVGATLGFSGLQPMQKKHYLAITPWISIEYAVKNNVSLVAWTRYHKGYDDVTITNSHSVYNSNGDYVGTVKEDVPRSSNQLTTGLGMRYYTRSNFAPMGIFLSGGLHWVHMRGLDGAKPQNTFGVHLGFGHNYVFFDRMLFNYEVLYAYTYGISRIFVFDDNKEYRHHFDAIMSNILTLKVGIGFLPF